MQFLRPAVLRRLNGSDERGLVGCAAAAPAGHLTAEVGIVDLDPVAERDLPATLEHHLHQLVLHPPGGVVFDPEVARELQRRQALLALGEREDGEEPLGQREFRAVEDGSGGQRGLVVALMALVYLTAVQRTACGVTAFRAHETLWPPQPVQGLLALLLAAVLLEKRLKAETFLELNRVYGHDGFLRVFRQFHCFGTSGSLAEPWG